MCCRISELGVAQGQGLADKVLLRAYTCVFQKKTQFMQGCTQGSKVVWDWPKNCCCKHTHVCVAESCSAAASLHICVSETASSRLHPRITGYTGLADQLREYVKSGCIQEPRATSVWPTTCCCEHTRVCVCCKIKSTQGCTQGRHVTRVRSTRCCCEPTHMCCRIFQFNVARKGQKIICRCEHTHAHMCHSEQVNSRLHPKIKSYKGLANQVLL